MNAGLFSFRQAARWLIVTALVLNVFSPALSVAQTASTATISGVVTDTSGIKLGGVELQLDGAQAARTMSQGDGSFSFANLTPGVYRLVAHKASFDPLSRTDITVAPGSTVRIDISVAPVSFTSLRTIGTTSTAVGPGATQMNTSTAAISTVSAATLADQDVHQVSQLLNQIPGIVTTIPGNSTNISAGIASTIQVPQIRGALQYETESLIDGHPISVGASGYFTPLFIDPNQLQSVEIAKGPGSTPADINYAVGGSVNYITLQPTVRPRFSVSLDEDSYGGTKTNLQATGTTDRGKLGYAFAYGIDGTPGPFRNNYPTLGAPTIAVVGSGATVNGVPFCGTAAAGTGCFQTGVPGPGPANQVGLPGFDLPIAACCDQLNSQYINRSELAKLRYSFSEQTSLTVAFLGGQNFAAYAQTFNYPGIVFTPPAGYTGSIPANTPLPYAFLTYSPNQLQTTQGLLESELRTSIGSNSVLLRYYTGANNSDNTSPYAFGATETINTLLWGGLPNANGGTTFYNGTPATISVQGSSAYLLTQDHYNGLSAEFDIPQGDNLFTFSLDRTQHNSYQAQFYELSSQDTTVIPYGSSQAFTTALARAQVALSPKINLNFANYFINYKTHYTADGGVSFQDSSKTTYAPRLALTYRADRNSIVRFSTGASIAPPYLALVTTQSGAPQPNVEGNPSYYTVTSNTGSITPETAFGYDLGYDRRLAREMVISGDVYLTNLHGQFLTTSSADGTYTGTSGANVGITAPLFVQQAQNLGSSRYEGIELALYRAPALGAGFRVQGSLQRAFTYNLPTGFYDTAAGANTANLGVIPNINFQPSSLTFNGISNGRIPYSTGYAEFNYHWKRALFLVGATYYGPNNSYNQPAFGVVNASVRYDLDRFTNLQLTGNNITSAYSTTIGSLQGGIGVPLVGGLLGAVPGVTVGPSNFHLVLRHAFSY